MLLQQRLQTQEDATSRFLGRESGSGPDRVGRVPPVGLAGVPGAGRGASTDFPVVPMWEDEGFQRDVVSLVCSACVREESITSSARADFVREEVELITISLFPSVFLVFDL